MKKTLYIFLLCILSTPVFCQNSNPSIKLIYKATSSEASEELQKFIAENKEANEAITIKVKNYSRLNKIILTDDQYNEIKEYVNNFQTQDAAQQIEFNTFKENRFARYIPISELKKN